MSAQAKYFQPEVLSRISRLELRARHVVEGFVSGMHKSPYRGFSVEFVSHRPYVPGDDIRHIDWRVYGKADRFFIKEYEAETNMRVHLLLDCSGSMAYPEHPGTPRMAKWDYAATLTASLAHLLVHQQDAVSLTLFDDGLRQRLPASTNRASLRILAEAIENNAPRDKTNLKTLLQHLVGSIPQRGMVVLVSDLLADIDETLAGLRQLRWRNHDVLVLHVLDHDELEFPFADRTLFEGIEDVDVQILTDPQSLRSSYLASLGRFLSKIRGVCVDQRIDYALISTADSLDVALTKFLATRMHRQRAGA